MNIRQQEILEKNLAENSGQNTEIEQYIERSDLSDILEDEIFENFSFCESKAGKSILISQFPFFEAIIKKEVRNDELKRFAESAHTRLRKRKQCTEETEKVLKKNRKLENFKV